MSKISEIINKLVKSENLSTVSANKVLGISKTQLGRYLSGFYEPSLKNAIIICNHFKCSLDYLLGLDFNINRFGKLNEPNFDIFLNRYFSLLDQRKISHYSLANELTFNRNNLNYWKKCKSFPSLDILTKIASKFSISVDYLIGRTDID